MAKRIIREAEIVITRKTVLALDLEFVENGCLEGILIMLQWSAFMGFLDFLSFGVFRFPSFWDEGSSTSLFLGYSLLYSWVIEY